MSSMPEPEIIPPGARGGRDTLTDQNLERLARLLDDIWVIPGTPLRFGLDPIVGFIPGLGDIITGLISFIIVFAAWQRGIPKITITRMIVNIAIDTGIGAVPIVGDIFDVLWKSNRMNYNLLVRSTRGRSTQSWRDWVFLLFLLACAAAVVILPVLTLVILLHWMFTGYWGNAR